MSKRSAAFIGNMNAMPMAYALMLREQGWEVTYFVDTPPSDKLSRPELKFPSIGYPYPGWVIERPVRSQLLAALSPEFLLTDIIRILREADVVFLSGFFLTLARFLKPTQKIVFLSYGSDLDTWCDRDSIERLADFFSRRLGKLISRRLVKAVVGRMISSLNRATAVVTFPSGLSAPGDRVIARELARSKATLIPRYDISFADLPPWQGTGSAVDRGILNVICGTRHTFNNHPGLSEGENKGTDVIIRGLARYMNLGRKRVRVHFFEKGLDVLHAKAMCDSEGISSNVMWHPELPFQDFLRLHQSCHIAFDQLGCHWVGSGMYAMYLGMPVIANSRREVLDRFWGQPSPICHANDEGDIVQWLIRLEDPQARKEIGEESHRFAADRFDCAHTTRAIVKCLAG